MVFIGATAPCRPTHGAAVREHTIRLVNGKQFAAKPDVTLLDAAQAAGLTLEHGCRTGRCGSCKTQVTAGQTERIQADSYLSRSQRQAGWILTCADAARSDASISAEDLGALHGISAKTWPARIDQISLLAADVCRVVLRLPPKAGLQFLAGQYVNIIGQGGLRRSYSMANAPQADGQLEFFVRRVDAGVMSAYWFTQAKVGDLLRVDGPHGTFFLRDVAGQDLTLLATGTGIAPIKAMLADLANRPAAQQPRTLQLLWGGRVPNDLFWAPDATLPGLQYTPVLSRAGTAWAGACGHVQDVLLRQSPPLHAAQVYACGSPAMLAAAQRSVLAAGLPAPAFYADAFVCSDRDADALTLARTDLMPA